MSKLIPTAYLNTDKLANICPHKDMQDTWLDENSFKTSEGKNLLGRMVETTTAMCTRCESLVVFRSDPRYNL